MSESNLADYRGIVLTREMIIEKACEQLVTDLKTIEPLSYAQLFSHGDNGVLFQHVVRLIEKRFPHGNLIFSCTGQCIVKWSEAPVVAIDLELVATRVFAFFRLFFGGATTVVELHHISFENPDNNPEENTQLLTKELQLHSPPIRS